MRNNALPFTGATLVLGIFAAFLRWLQNMNIFDEATGLARSGAGISIVLLLYVLVCAAVFAALTLLWLRRGSCPALADEALKSPGPLPGALAWVCAAVCVAAALALMFTAAEAVYPRLQRVFAAAAIFGGLCFPFLPQRSGASRALGRAAAAVLPLACVVGLVFVYYSEANDAPVLWRAAPECLALAAAAVGFCGAAGFFFGAARPRVALLFLQLAAFLCIGVIFDSRSVWRTAMLAADAVMCLVLEWLIVYNMKEK